MSEAEAAKFMADQEAIAKRTGVDRLSDEEIMADALKAVEEVRQGKRGQK